MNEWHYRLQKCSIVVILRNDMTIEYYILEHIVKERTTGARDVHLSSEPAGNFVTRPAIDHSSLLNCADLN